MILTIIILLLFGLNQYSCESLTISGSTSVCGPRPKPVAMGKAVVLLGQSHIGIPAACFNQVDPGPCSQDLVRIYYDSKTYTCKAFSYSGCGGNANRFVSVKNCYKLCHPYYRQRFIGLGADNAVNPKPLPPFVAGVAGGGAGAAAAAGASAAAVVKVEYPSSTPATKVKLSSGQEANIEIVNYSGVNLNDTDSGNSTEAAKTVTNFAGSISPNEEPPQVEVIHEYDTYVPSPQFAPQSRSGYPGAPLPFGFPPNYPPLYSQSRNGFLQNIQHSDYNPVGGYIPTKDGYRPQSIQSQQIYYTNQK